MSLTRAEVVAYLDRLTTSELAELIEALQARLQVRPLAPLAAPAPRIVMGMSLDPRDEQTEFAVILRGHADHKIAVIKAIRELWPIGIKEARDLVEAAPVRLREALPRAEAEAIAARLRALGAEVEVA